MGNSAHRSHVLDLQGHAFVGRILLFGKVTFGHEPQVETTRAALPITQEAVEFLNRIDGWHLRDGFEQLNLVHLVGEILHRRFKRLDAEREALPRRHAGIIDILPRIKGLAQIRDFIGR